MQADTPSGVTGDVRDGAESPSRVVARRHQGKLRKLTATERQKRQQRRERLNPAREARKRQMRGRRIFKPTARPAVSFPKMPRPFFKEPTEAAKRDPHFPRQSLTERPMVLSEETKVRGGATSRRRVARVWRAA